MALRLFTEIKWCVYLCFVAFVRHFTPQPPFQHLENFMYQSACTSNLPVAPNPPTTSLYQADLAWAAGFLDGEGCIHIAKQRYRSGRNHTYRLGVHVTQNDRPALQALCQAIGFSAPIYATKRAHNHRRQCYTVNFTGHSALRLLQAVMPYLRRKLSEAKAALQFWDEGCMGRRGGGKRLAPALIAVREHYYLLLKQLK